MCRLAGFAGHKPLALSGLLYDPPHSLEHAAHAPREMLNGSVNVDGTGVAWWREDESTPLRYVTTAPPWADPNLPGLAPALTGQTLLAAVRSATAGIPHGPENVAPFAADGFAGVHNGWIGAFRDGVGRTMIDRLDDTRFQRLNTMNDSLALFLLVTQHLADHDGATLDGAVESAIRQTAADVMAADEAATLNLVVGQKDKIVAARTSAGFEVNSLYVRTTDVGSWVASEPLDDDPSWTPLPEHSVAVLTAEGIDVRPIAHDGVAV